MIAALVLLIRITLDIALSCHCLTWTRTEYGYRCTQPIERARCEFVPTGWHLAAVGVSVCTRRCDDS